MSKYVMVLDVSKWQGSMDWETMERAKVRGLIVRTSDGTYVDPIFRKIYREAHYQPWMDYGVSHYHFMRMYRSPEEQLAVIRKQLDGLPEPNLFGLEGYSFLDCEHYTSPDQRSRNTAVIEQMVKIGKAAGMLFGIYTSQGWWNPNVLRSKNWSKLPLWVANWTSAEAPAMPIDWAVWDVWQYQCNKGGGPAYGVASQDIDLNRMRAELEPVPMPEEFPDEMTVHVQAVFGEHIYEGVCEAQKDA